MTPSGILDSYLDVTQSPTYYNTLDTLILHIIYLDITIARIYVYNMYLANTIPEDMYAR